LFVKANAAVYSKSIIQISSNFSSDRNFMAKVFTIPVVPDVGRKRRERTSDPRYVDGQRLLVEAMRYLAQSDPIANRHAIELLSEHVRTRFRMTDSPLG
jgi:hypothetical protein